MIPAQAVEAAAKAIYHTSGRSRQMPYSAGKEVCEEEAKQTLEAAAPHMVGCDDALWQEFQAATQQAGTNPSVVIRRLVREWVDTRKASDD